LASPELDQVLWLLKFLEAKKWIIISKVLREGFFAFQVVSAKALKFF